jgi:hypothetical protein
MVATGLPVLQLFWAPWHRSGPQALHLALFVLLHALCHISYVAAHRWQVAHLCYVPPCREQLLPLLSVLPVVGPALYLLLRPKTAFASAQPPPS